MGRLFYLLQACGSQLCCWTEAHHLCSVSLWEPALPPYAAIHTPFLVQRRNLPLRRPSLRRGRAGVASRQRSPRRRMPRLLRWSRRIP